MYNKKIEEQYFRKISLFRERISRLVLSGNIPFSITGHVSKDPIPLKESVRLER
jgi:hypothetical protein